MSQTLYPAADRSVRADPIYPLNEFYAREGLPLPKFELIQPEAMPQPYRELLVHDNDMTPTLEAYHGRGIHIEVLGRERRDDSYFREVILRLDRDGRAVEFGASKISLNLLTPLVRRLILQEQLPIGHILKAHEVPHSGKPSAYFQVDADSIMQRSLGAHPGQILYGRRNTLRDGAGRVLCEVVEILPPARDPDPNGDGDAAPSPATASA